MYNYIVMNDILYKYHSGFLPGHSTVHHLIELTHITCLSPDNYGANCQVFSDISKAFDRVWHKNLLRNLEKNGVKGDVLLWIKSYLRHRTQNEFVNSVLSSETSINAGIYNILHLYYDDNPLKIVETHQHLRSIYLLIIKGQNI